MMLQKRMMRCLLLAAFLATACNGAPGGAPGTGTQETDPEATAARTALQDCRSRNDALKSEAERLGQAVRDLQLKNQLLVYRNRDLRAWTRKLTDGYGPGIWYMDDTTMPVFVQPMASAGPPEIIAELNRRLTADGLPAVELVGVAEGTAALKVADETQLTQRMGSHGAESYIQAVLYSVASVAGVDCIAFSFTEGDHAAPGQYCK